MILTSVDLPAPFSPSRARIEPPVASRSTPWRTSTPPNDLRTPRAARVVVLLMPLDQRDQGGHDPGAVELGEVGGVGDPVLEPLLAAHVAPRGRVGALAG